ncbi:MAG: SOS response-associated peptidase [Verrucomicrobiota bacterium]
MCGRYTLSKKSVEVQEAETALPDFGWEPRFNIAPTQRGVVITKASAVSPRQASYMRWGLIPSWSKSLETQRPLINARSETVAEKPSFKAAYQRRRCLVPADGFFEWKRLRKGNQPYYFQMEDESLFHMAGLWECWRSQSGDELNSYTILTTSANALLGKYHDRMPVIVAPEDTDTWLDGEPELFTPEGRFRFFTPFSPSEMKHRPVSPAVNNNRSEGPQLIEPYKPELESQLDLGL